MTAAMHGGDLAWAEAEFGTPKQEWIDLSTGINPWPWNVDPDLCSALHRLPDSRHFADLLTAAQRNYDVPGSMQVVSAPGSQALIQWLPRLRPTARVAVVSPTYGGHAPAWKQAGHHVETVSSIHDAHAPDVVVLARPNNPDGRIVPQDELLSLASDLADRNGWLVVDEAFADCCPADSVVRASLPSLVVIRSFGKFYGLPGLRLGFAICTPALAAALSEALGPWAISTMAAEIGRRALLDSRWQENSRLKLARFAKRLDGVLAGGGLQVVGGTPLFRLGRSPHARIVYESLGRSGILARNYSEAPDLLRFGLPGPEEHWQRLEQALAS